MYSHNWKPSVNRLISFSLIAYHHLIRRRKSKHDCHQIRIVQANSNKEEQSIFCQNGSVHGKTRTREEGKYEDEYEDEHGPNRIIHGTTAGEEDEYDDEYGQNRIIHGKTGDEDKDEDEQERFC